MLGTWRVGTGFGGLRLHREAFDEAFDAVSMWVTHSSPKSAGNLDTQERWEAGRINGKLMTTKALAFN